MAKEEMGAKEQIEMMRRTSAEIKQLRAQIAALQPKADAYDNMAALIGLLPKASRGYGEDLAWLLDKRIAELEAAAKAETTDKSADRPTKE